MFLEMKWVISSFLLTATVSVVESRSLILGGDQVNPNDYPYFVHTLYCGGTLIAPDIVLTAAHCEDRKNVQFSIGAYRLGSLEGGAQERFCEVWIRHPDYYVAANFDYDFALCKLNEPVTIDESTVRLELNNASSIPTDGEELIGIGLGLVDSGSGYNVPEFVQDVTIPAVSNYRCGVVWRFGMRITENKMCAGTMYSRNHQNTCHGDSGGPLIKRTVQEDGTIVDTHVGLTSYGYTPCGRIDKPVVYARTSSGLDWIQDTMCNHLHSVSALCDNSVPSSISICDGEDLTIEVTTDGFASQTFWKLTDSANNEIMIREYLINNYANEHTLCLESNECYKWELHDRMGDGMDGSYTFTLNGDTIISGDGATDSGEWTTYNENGMVYAKKTEWFCIGSATRPATELPSPSCEDDESFRYNSLGSMSCSNWVARGQTTYKCGRIFQDIPVYDWCPQTCGEVGLGSCAP